MKALIKQTPASKKEVFYASQWLDWMDSETGAPLNADPYGYALAEDAPSDDPTDYDVQAHTSTDDDGNVTTTYTAAIKAGWRPRE